MGDRSATIGLGLVKMKIFGHENNKLADWVFKVYGGASTCIFEDFIETT